MPSHWLYAVRECVTYFFAVLLCFSPFGALTDRLPFANTWEVSKDYASCSLSPPTCPEIVETILTFVAAFIKLALWRQV